MRKPWTSSPAAPADLRHLFKSRGLRAERGGIGFANAAGMPTGERGQLRQRINIQLFKLNDNDPVRAAKNADGAAGVFAGAATSG